MFERETPLPEITVPVIDNQVFAGRGNLTAQKPLVEMTVPQSGEKTETPILDCLKQISDKAVTESKVSLLLGTYTGDNSKQNSTLRKDQKNY